MEEKILRKIIQDFAPFDSRITELLAEARNADDLKELLRAFYYRNAFDEKVLNFVANYQFPDSYAGTSLDENYSPYPLLPVFFFKNPFCYGRITKYENVLKFFAYNPDEFVRLFNSHRKLFQFQPKLFSNLTLILGSVKLKHASPEVLQFYEEYIIKPTIHLMLKRNDGIPYASSLITTFCRNQVPDEIASKYISDLVTVIERDVYTQGDFSMFVHTENIDFYTKFPELTIAVFNKVKEVTSTRTTIPHLAPFFLKLPEEVIDFLEKEHGSIFKKIISPDLQGLLIANPFLSPKKHKKLYRKALKQFVKEDIQVLKYLRTPVKVPEDAVELFGFRESFLILKNAVYLYKTYLDFPYKSFQKKAFMFVVKNPSYMKEFQELVKKYQELEKPVNPKIAKVMFYEFCLSKLKKYGGNAPVLREIYCTFARTGKKLTTKLIEEFLITKALHSHLREFEDFLYYTKVRLSYEKVFEKYAETIISCLQNTEEKKQ